jgi:hypothetical protein
MQATMTKGELERVMTREVEYAREVVETFPDQDSIRAFVEWSAGRTHQIEADETVYVLPE